MEYLTKWNDRELFITSVEDALDYFVSPLEEEVIEPEEFYSKQGMEDYIEQRDNFIKESKDAESLNDFVKIYNRYTDLLDGAELIYKVSK